MVIGERRRVEMIRRLLGDGRPLIREYSQRFTYLEERIRAQTISTVNRDAGGLTDGH